MKFIQIYKSIKICVEVFIIKSSQLVKQIFESEAKKENRVNPNHEHYQKVASYKTMESYRNIWNNFLTIFRTLEYKRF